MMMGSRMAKARPLLVAIVVIGAWGCHTRRPVASDSVVAPRDTVAPKDVRVQARIPRDASRFEIEVVDDTTIRFKPREALWVKAGQQAYAADPFNRDVLVARLRIVSVWNETAVAVISSQVTRVTTRHVVLMTAPTIPWWKAKRFWIGAMLGAAFGGTVGVIATR